MIHAKRDNVSYLTFVDLRENEIRILPMMKTKATIIDYYYTIKEFHPWQLVNELSAVFWLTTPRGWSVNIGQLGDRSGFPRHVFNFFVPGEPPS